MNTFIGAALLCILINQFLIKVSINELEEKVKLYGKNDERFQKWCSDVVNYIFSTRR